MLSLGSFRKLRDNIQSTLQTIIAFSKDGPTAKPQHLITAVFGRIADGESPVIGYNAGGFVENSNLEHFDYLQGLDNHNKSNAKGHTIEHSQSEKNIISFLHFLRPLQFDGMNSTGFGRIVNRRKWFSSDLLDYSVTLRQHEAICTSQPPSPGVRASSYLQFYNGAVLFKDFNFVFHHGWSMAEPQEMATVNFSLTSPALEYFLMTRQIPRFSGIMGPFESDWGGRWGCVTDPRLSIPQPR